MTRIITSFDAASTAAEVVAGIDLSGRRAVVTGGGSGIGLETVRALAGAGAEVTIGVRDVEAGRRVAAGVDGAVRVRHLDLLDGGSVAAFAAGWDGPLDILVNNAGIAAPPARQLTADGVELQFAANYLAHVALTLGLFPALEAAQEARVVAVSSAGQLHSPVVFDDLNFERRPYTAWLADAQSKTATVLFAVAASRHWADDGVTVNAVRPGGVRQTPEQGAATSVLVATTPLLKGIGGGYFEDCNEAEPGTAAFALDPDAASCLWDTSLAMLAPWATAMRA